MTALPPPLKATVAVGIFALASIEGFIFSISRGAILIPLLVFQVLLLINTFLSIRCFATVIPKDDRAQQVIDVILVCIYLVTPFALHDPFLFVSGITALFTIATLKYALLRKQEHERRLIRRKLSVDIAGTLLSLAALVGIWAGYPGITTALWAGIFFCANIYLIYISPLYRLGA
jgi:hypothetical protein